MAKRAFGRVEHADERDRGYLLRAAVPEMIAGVPRPAKKTWYLPERLNQGSKPHCVGFSWKGFLLSKPKRRTAWSPQEIYRRAQVLDGIPGENYDGTTVRGGAVFLKKEAGVMASYRWAFNLSDALDGCAFAGPLVLGTDWHQGMMTPDEAGLIKVTGPKVGGHAYLLLGYDDAKQRALVHNSWGAGWGLDGRAYLSYGDLSALIAATGEACIALEI